MCSALNQSRKTTRRLFYIPTSGSTEGKGDTMRTLQAGDLLTLYVEDGTAYDRQVVTDPKRAVQFHDEEHGIERRIVRVAIKSKEGREWLSEITPPLNTRHQLFPRFAPGSIVWQEHTTTGTKP